MAPWRSRTLRAAADRSQTCVPSTGKRGNTPGPISSRFGAALASSFSTGHHGRRLGGMKGIFAHTSSYSASVYAVEFSIAVLTGRSVPRYAAPRRPDKYPHLLEASCASVLLGKDLRVALAVG